MSKRRLKITIEGYGVVTVKIPEPFQNENKKLFCDAVTEGITQTMNLMVPVADRFHMVLGQGGYVENRDRG